MNKSYLVGLIIIFVPLYLGGIARCIYSLKKNRKVNDFPFFLLVIVISLFSYLVFAFVEQGAISTFGGGKIYLSKEPHLYWFFLLLFILAETMFLIDLLGRVYFMVTQKNDR
jgi:hypothetical protein